jgi:D-sedoheptulose 7-phosphate isomerase
MKHFEELARLYQKIAVTDGRSQNLKVEEGFQRAMDMIPLAGTARGKVMLIGNGGSAAIASHVMTDFVRSARIPAVVFTDASLFTCISNDFGYESVYEKPIEVLAQSGDVLIAISSSGRSENILKGVRAARAKKTRVITLSGFSEDNPLKKMGDVNFYGPSSSYRQVEITHLTICHSLVDTIIKQQKADNG